MKPRNLILFVLLIINTSLVAQKRAQRPRPVKQSAQNVEKFSPDVQADTVSVIINCLSTGNSTSLEFLSATNNQALEQWPMPFHDKLNKQTISATTDRFTNSVSGVLRVNHSTNVHSLGDSQNYLSITQRNKLIERGQNTV